MERSFSDRLEAAFPALSQQLLRGGIIELVKDRVLEAPPIRLVGRGQALQWIGCWPCLFRLVAGERHVKRRRREATTAGGMKVAVSPAVGAGPWGWGTRGRGGGGVVRLLLILSGCVACGSGTAGAAAAMGAGAEGVIFRKVGSVPRVWTVFPQWGVDVVRKRQLRRRH